jgi:hypothetical protein
MKKIFLSCVLISSFLFAAAQKEIINDPDVEVREMKESFTSIKVSGGIDLYLSQDDKEVVAVSSTDTKTRDGIKTVVENGVLKIFYDGDRGWGNWKNRKMRAYVSFSKLENLIASGASDVQVAGAISGESLEIDLSGASDFKGAVKLINLKIDLSGASDIRISGTANTVNIASSGASDVKGFDLVTDNCTAKASGASDINITVNKEINANASGASDIKYKGDAVLKESRSNGASSIGKKG